MNINDVNQLWDRFEASKADRLEIDMDGVHFVLDKHGEMPCVPVAGMPVAPRAPFGGAVQAPVRETEGNTAVNSTVSAGSTEAVKNTAVSDGGTPVNAPLVGTFYRAPSPEDKPFVEVGQKVKKGDVVGIIEAMKLMNEINAPADGVVEEILAENGNMVEFNETLMILR